MLLFTDSVFQKLGKRIFLAGIGIIHTVYRNHAMLRAVNANCATCCSRLEFPDNFRASHLLQNRLAWACKTCPGFNLNFSVKNEPGEHPNQN